MTSASLFREKGKHDNSLHKESPIPDNKSFSSNTESKVLTNRTSGISCFL